MSHDPEAHHERLRIAHDNLTMAEAWTPTNDFDRARKADNITQIRAEIARLEHPSHPA